PNAAALSTSTGLANSWNPSANARVYTLALNGTTLYAGGEFTRIGGPTRNYIATLHTTTGAALSWNPNASLTVWSIAVSGDRVIAGGEFATIGGQVRNGIAALDAA